MRALLLALACPTAALADLPRYDSAASCEAMDAIFREVDPSLPSVLATCMAGEEAGRTWLEPRWDALPVLVRARCALGEARRIRPGPGYQGLSTCVRDALERSAPPIPPFPAD